MTELARSTPHKSAIAFRDARHANLIRHQDEWLDYDGSAYQVIEDATIEAELSAFMIDARVRVVDNAGNTAFAPFNPRSKDISEVRDALEKLCHKPANTMSPPCWLDGRAMPDVRNVVSCSNGLLDITTGELMAATPLFFTRTALPIQYADELDLPECTRWNQFLVEVTGGNVEMIALLQETVGYLISGDTAQQKVFFLFGAPRSGKGTFLRMVTALIGPNNISSPTIESLGDTFGYQDLIGKSLAIVSDMSCSDHKKLSTAANRINAISGEDAVQANRKGKRHWNGRLATRFLIAGNNLPDFGEHMLALASRLQNMPFQQSFEGHEDFDLESKLKAELPGILLWALKGLTRLRARGRFNEPPQQSKAIKERMLHLANPVRGFVEDHIEVVPNASCIKSDVYDYYREVFCRKHGVRHAPLNQFAEDIYKVVPTAGASKPRTADGDRVRMFTGIRFNQETMAAIYEVEADPDDEATMGLRVRPMVNRETGLPVKRRVSEFDDTVH